MKGSLLAGPLFSRSPCLRARRRCLLLLGINACPKGVHEIDHLGRRTLFGWFYLFSGLFLLEQIDQRVLIAVVELSRIEVAGFCLDDMSGKIEHLFRESSARECPRNTPARRELRKDSAA